MTLRVPIQLKRQPWMGSLWGSPVLAVVAAVAVGAGGCSEAPQVYPASATQFEKPGQCGQCHPTHLREWQGSIMHYAAGSPVFNAFELTVRKLTNGEFAANGAQPNFCIGCHSPTGVFNRELPDFIDAASARPAMADLTGVSREGLSCDFCHRVTGPDRQKSLLGDGIANLSLLFGPGIVKMGPIANPAKNDYHAARESPYLRSAQFCGACHDVRIPKPDLVTGEPFQRLENLFTEWEQGPYNSTRNRFGKVIRCQDCHMSLYPRTQPGVFPTMKVASGLNMPLRRHAIHAFTAVSSPLVADPRYPNVDTDEHDDFGYPLGQEQRRAQMLRAACSLTLEGTPASLAPGATVLPVRVVVTNTGAGHRVPSGFSQERQVWLHLEVRDDAGLIYESGYLRDKAHPETGEMSPDGRLDDEDLDDRHFHVDPETLDSSVEPGPDVDRRPDGVNLGLKNFQNRFVRLRTDGTWEPVLNPLLADHMDNSRSLPMLEPVEVRYDVPLPTRALVGNVRVSVRLRYRTFPPELLRLLAIREPQLVSEDTVDRNKIVDMAQVQTVISVQR